MRVFGGSQGLALLIFMNFPGPFNLALGGFLDMSVSKLWRKMVKDREAGVLRYESDTAARLNNSAALPLSSNCWNLPLETRGGRGGWSLAYKNGGLEGLCPEAPTGGPWFPPGGPRRLLRHKNAKGDQGGRCWVRSNVRWGREASCSRSKAGDVLTAACCS